MRQFQTVLYAAKRCTRSLAQHRHSLGPKGSTQQEVKMTHDELLAKIDTLEARYTDYPTYLALRAVVELCANRDFVTIGDKSIFNAGRNSVKEEIIQAIEKELI